MIPWINQRRRYLLPAFVLIITALLPLFLGFNQYYLTVLILMLVFIIYASAWNFLTFQPGFTWACAFLALADTFLLLLR